MSIEVSVQLGDEHPPGRDPRPHFALARRAAERTLRGAGFLDAFLSVTFLGDAAIAELNETHLGHAGPTDVLSFRLEGPCGELAGDVYVGHEFAARTAADEGLPWEEELVRLSVHGVLHVLGHDHPAGPERERCDMWRLQEDLVAQVMGEAAGPPAEGRGGRSGAAGPAGRAS